VSAASDESAAKPVVRVFPVLPQRGQKIESKTVLSRWLATGGRSDEAHPEHHTKPWYVVLWLTGVDYFSTLGYQPGIALLAAGALSPFATAILVAVTLFGALPIYSAVAARSYAGQGSIAMLERLLSGWSAKLLVLVLLGFAATDFVITMTLSAADAVQHILENPYLHGVIGEGARVPLTILLLALLAIVFLRGFTEAIGLAAAVAVPYILLNVVVLARGMIEIFSHPDVFPKWTSAVSARGDVAGLVLASILIFPKLALGLSGFETGVSVMPLVAGEEGEVGPGKKPLGRIASTRKLLAAAALIMSVLLIASSFVTTLLVSEEAYREGGDASGRALAYLAHTYLGSVFGTVYDVATILILWFAGASAMAGLLNVIPRYLPRFGMAPVWVAYRRPLVLVLFGIDVLVTIAFHADVEAQGGAYATGVLVLMLSAAVAVALAFWRDGARPASVAFWLIAGIFAFTLVDNVLGRPDGLIIATVFILSIMLLSAISRYLRAFELRSSALAFCDTESLELWHQITGRKVNLVPIKASTAEWRARKAKEIAKYYVAEGPMAFLHVGLADNTSEFQSQLVVTITREGEHYLINVRGAIAIANTIAYVSELIDPLRIFLGLTRQNAVGQAVRYLLWGEGETGYLVYKILTSYWAWTPEDDVRPLIFLFSD
jgi:hypothetical protein